MAPAMKKNSTSKANASSATHPPYFQMISEAITSLKDRTGSSQPAIAKFIEEQYKTALLPNFKKILSVQLKKFVKSKKLTKVKNSYKVSSVEKVRAARNIKVIIQAGIITPLLHLLQNAKFEIKKEAAHAISNAISEGTDGRITFLATKGCIKLLCDFLDCPDPRTVIACLEGLENILRVGEIEKKLGFSGDVNVFALMIDDAEGLEKIENLETHDNKNIYEKAIKILETYWPEEDDEQLPSDEEDDEQFTFG